MGSPILHDEDIRAEWRRRKRKQRDKQYTDDDDPRAGINTRIDGKLNAILYRLDAKLKANAERILGGLNDGNKAGQTSQA